MTLDLSKNLSDSFTKKITVVLFYWMNLLHSKYDLNVYPVDFFLCNS